MANIAAQRIKREFKEVIKSEEVRNLIVFVNRILNEKIINRQFKLFVVITRKFKYILTNCAKR